MFKLFDNKGQSSSVFNLLIAALVSLAILGLLLSIMGVIDVTGTGQSPDTIIKNLINNAAQNPKAPQPDTITFSGKYKNLNAGSIAAKTDVGAESLFFYNCTTSNDITLPSSKAVNYTNSTKQKFDVEVICSSDNIDDLAIYGLRPCDSFDDPSDGTTTNCHILIYNNIG